MYCHKCGLEQSDQHKFCANCGAELNSASQPQPHESNDCHTKPSVGEVLGKSFVMSLVVVFIFFGLLTALGFYSGDSEETISAEADTAQGEMDALAPDNGWYTENGKQYFFHDGAMCVDFAKIDGDYYYFNKDGSLAVNMDVDYETCIFKAGRDGKIDRVILKYVSGELSEEKYHFGNNGRSLILELEIPVEDCRSMSFYLEANGQRGAKANGEWKIYVRNNGEWEFLQTIDYTEPSGSFEIVCDVPKSFDAITAYPMKRGNATFDVFFCLENVDYPIEVLSNLAS